MTNAASGAWSLLPGGFRDRLPPGAEAAAHLMRTIVDRFSSFGYDRVQPPLVEYEANLARWLGKPQTTALFRSPDPATGAGLALRPDITGQIARIAATRMADAPRPLRLAYAGRVLRARASQLDPTRELIQAGAELIGNDSEAVVAEIINSALEALRDAGVSALSVDLTTPELVGALADGRWPVANRQALLEALDSKDEGALQGLGATDYRTLIRAAGTGNAEEALGLIAPIAPALTERLTRLVALLPNVRVTVDPTERHGFEYQSWVGFSLFGAANGQTLRTEIGRGGAYLVQHPDGTTEAAAGVSLYLDTLVDAGLGVQTRQRIFLPLGTSADTAAKLRQQGYVTVMALADTDSPDGCSHIWDGTQAIEKD